MSDASPAVLRVMTCGSVDDGKSTLIGRLLFESGALPDDVLAALKVDSRAHGTTGDALDFALLVDGLEAEREQGITIDVAYRYFSSANRKLVLADTPGHELYTRNMVTAASSADIAILLVDARKGVSIQTRRHAMIAGLLGVGHVVLAVNKMDLVDWSAHVYEDIRSEFDRIAQLAGLPSWAAIPVCACDGDNIVVGSTRMPWYAGPSVLQHLDQVELAVPAENSDLPLRLPVQWVCRPSPDFRGYAGTIASGLIRVGQSVEILPAHQTTVVASIATPGGAVEEAAAGEAVMVTLADEVPLRRGDWLVEAAQESGAEGGDPAQPSSAGLINATLVWMAHAPLVPERQYYLRHATAERTAQVMRIRHKIDVVTGSKLTTRTLSLNDIAECELSLDSPLLFETYASSRTLGGFVLIDRVTSDTVAAGMIRFGLRRDANLHRHAFDIDSAARAAIKGQRSCCIWLTGLSGAGKSTIANALDHRLFDLGRHAFVLDGDNVRLGLNRDLGFTEADRVENIRRLTEVARLMVDAGLIVVVAAISPFRSERDAARARFEDGTFVEVFVDTPIEVCEQRDVKGLYAKARAGGIANFTGISSPYEPPVAPSLVLHGDGRSVDELVTDILGLLQERRILS